MSKENVTKKTHEAQDWHKADIKAALEKAGWNFASLAFACGYKSGSTLRHTLDRSFPKGEKIIASVIGVKPEAIWPSRYTHKTPRPVLVLPPSIVVPAHRQPV